MHNQPEFNRIAEYIVDSDLPRKQQKLAGLRAAFQKGIRIELVQHPEAGDMVLVDGIAIDTSELENGYWL